MLELLIINGATMNRAHNARLGVSVSYIKAVNMIAVGFKCETRNNYCY
jgi:hypothetical protein